MIRIITIIIISLVLLSCGNDRILEKKIDNIFTEFNNNSTPGASVAIVKDKNTIYQKGFGLADLENNVSIEPKTNFRLASITKQFTALSIMLLEDEGKLSFEDPIKKYFPNYPDYASKISIKNILQHTSGLLAYEDHMDDTLTVQLKDKDVLEILMKQDSTYFEPGTEHRYSNSGYAVLAMLVEQLSGKTFAQFLEERIFNPLGMNNSVAYENGISEVPNRAFGYAKTDSGFVFADQSLTSAVLGDGGIYSSTIDLIKWNESFENAELLEKNKLNKAFEKFVLPNGDTVNYGFGWRLDPYKDHYRPYHTGGTSGFSNIYMKLPEYNLIVFVLINIRDYDVKGYAEKVADLFLEN